MTTQGIIYFKVLTVMGYCISRDCPVPQWQRRQPPMPWCKQQNIPAAVWAVCPSLNPTWGQQQFLAPESWHELLLSFCSSLLDPDVSSFVETTVFHLNSDGVADQKQNPSFQSTSWTFSKSLKTQLFEHMALVSFKEPNRQCQSTNIHSFYPSCSFSTWHCQKQAPSVTGLKVKGTEAVQYICLGREVLSGVKITIQT